MQLVDFFDRILRAHWKLIVGLLLAGLVSGFFFHSDETPTYTSRARVLLDTETPEPISEADAKAVEDTARAIVTSPGFVAEALSQAGLSRSARRMVLNEQISASTVGSSAVVELSVSDPDPEAAARLANILADNLITTRLRSIRGTIDTALSEVEEQIPALETSLQALNARIPGAPDEARERLSRERDLLIQRLVILEEKRSDLLTSQAERPTPEIIDRARRAVEPDRSRRPLDVGLGGLLGLALGVGLALIYEHFNPSVIGGPAVSRELDAPVLGVLTTPPHRAEPDEVEPVAAWLSTAARGAGVRTVALTGTSPGDGLEDLAEQLTDQLDEDYPLDIRPVDLRAWENGGPGEEIGPSAAVVVVTPEIARRMDLVEVRDLFGMSGRRMLGALAYRGANGSALRRMRHVLLGDDRAPRAETVEPATSNRAGRTRKALQR